MKIGIVGTGAIAEKHALAWRSLGCGIRACSNRNPVKGQAFAKRWDAEFVDSADDLCRHPEVELVDVCAFPDYRLVPVSICAALRKPVQLQKPIATTVREAHRILDVVQQTGITLGVVSQRRFDDSSQFVHRAIGQGRLGKILEADCYVKWYRSPEYYARAGKGTWRVEGGGALINQAIHQIDMLRWLVGPVAEVDARWRLGALHDIESEDLVAAMFMFTGGALGVVQASTALWPGYPERIEIHGTRGSAVLSGDRLTHWDVQDGVGGEAPPVADGGSSGSSDPMAISTLPFERQFEDLLDAVREKRQPLVSAQDGVNALEIVEAIYESCRRGAGVVVGAGLQAAIELR